MAQVQVALPILEIECDPSSSSKQTQTSKYKLLTGNFISVLDKVGDCPFAVYCMSGNARLGKSYTLNFFIRKLRNQEIVDSSQLFKWRKGSERETVGINLWPEPFFTKDENGRKIGILLMDAQGLFDSHTTLQQNSVIFALSSLFSTVCIFNLSKQILTDTLQHVNFFTGYARAIGHMRKNKNGQQNDDGDDDSEKFQRLIVMVRDVEDDDEFGYGFHDISRAPLNSQGSRANYFREKFPTSTSNDNSIPYENLAIINGIRMNYDNVGIILHPDPGSAFKKNPTGKRPDQEFIDKSQEFVELMLSPEFLVTKKIGGNELTGKGFIPFVEHLGKICEKTEEFPPALTIAESASIFSHNLALTNARNEFRTCIETSLMVTDLSDAELVEVYGKAEKVALDAFHKIKKKKQGTPAQERETLSTLLKKCKANFEATRVLYVLSRSLAETMKGREDDALKLESLIRDREEDAAKIKGMEDAAEKRKLEDEARQRQWKKEAGAGATGPSVDDYMKAAATGIEAIAGAGATIAGIVMGAKKERAQVDLLNATISNLERSRFSTQSTDSSNYYPYPRKFE